MKPSDTTETRLDTIERIKERAKKENGGVTTVWAVRNAIKKTVQDWKVAQYVTMVDGKGKGNFQMSINWGPVLSMFGNDRAAHALLMNITDVAEQHGYEVTSDHRAIHVVQVE